MTPQIIVWLVLATLAILTIVLCTVTDRMDRKAWKAYNDSCDIDQAIRIANL